MSDCSEPLAFLSASQQAAVARLRDVLHRGGMALLCGPAGTGKTRLLQQLAGECAAGGHHVRGPLTVGQLAREVAENGEPVAAREAPRSRNTVVLLDDAHAVADAAELTRVVTGLERPGNAVVLAGEGRLLTLLARQPDLEQRVVLRAPLRPWDAHESRQLIAAALPDLLTTGDDEALSLRIHELAAGIPRQLVRLIDTVRMVLVAEPGHRLSVDDLETFHRRLFMQAA